MKFQDFLEMKKANDLFKRKVRIIKKHFKNAQHPLRMLADLFADEIENIQKSNSLSQQVNDNQEGKFMKLSDREKDIEN